MENEVWKDVKGFEGRYQVSNLGRVKGLKGRILKPSTFQGYKRVNLTTGNGSYKTISVHRLVAMAFVDGYADGLEVNHIDENHRNNRADNLEWMTHAKNCVYGTFTQRRMNSLRKIGYIRNVVQKDMSGNVIATFSSIKEASIKSGVPYTTIKNILRRGVKWRRDYIWEYEE